VGRTLCQRFFNVFIIRTFQIHISPQDDEGCGSEQISGGASRYDKTAPDLSIEQFLTQVSFESKKKLEELGLEFGMKSDKP
jgi:hypothetical protein